MKLMDAINEAKKEQQKQRHRENQQRYYQKNRDSIITAKRDKRKQNAAMQPAANPNIATA